MDRLSIPFPTRTCDPTPAPLSAAQVERLIAEGLERLDVVGASVGVGGGTLYRWITRGKGGIHLEGVWGARGKGLTTTVPAVARFLAAVTAGR